MREAQSIFVQIAETLKDRILSGEYAVDERIPSVRDVAVEVEVNPNTAMKAFELMQREELIYNKRGMGYFVAEGAPERIIGGRKKLLLETTLPELFHEMSLLGIGIEEIVRLYRDRKSLGSSDLGDTASR